MSYYQQQITTLHDLLDLDARNFTNAEIQLKNNLPLLITNASSLKLKTVLQRYLDFVEQHIHKMEDFFSNEKIIAYSRTERVMEALIQEVKDKFLICTDSAIKDACLLAGIQAINHFKISAYGTAAAFANALEMELYAAIFHEAEVNEKQIDDRLSQLAQFEINTRAKAPIELPG